MLSKKPTEIKSSEITDKKTYFGRRAFIRAAVLAGSAVGTGFLYRALNPPPPVLLTGDKLNGVAPASTELSAVEEKLTSLEDIANYNNSYEFSTNKQAVADRARNFVSRPWTVTVDGLVHKPKTFDLEELLRFQQEERIYRLRCVEGWSMVIPWAGFPLAELLKQVEPMSSANYVAFETLYDSARMPNQKTSVLPWPYAEGLRLDEALHPLTILATGIYGETLLPQNGAPIRLVVPWKYGFKSIKSIVRIRLVSEQPPTTWSIAAPREYGFYSNVNPKVAHPRWSQARERRIGEYGMRETLFFNGYGDQVAHLYSGLDLRVYF